ncbi:retinitis pigmentosa 9 protein homolog isoform X1 [Felis catus]|uniref:RP9 pre-mRNA splicing factor n=3 Tax=Felidae TaxID=9681 RepID=A0ABI7WE92_FELCA|nr:retinitis pigmentosa 9 protein homolog isoform X1 [Felis catus]
MRTRVSRSCWSAWPDFKRPRARPAPAGSRRVPMAVGEGQVVEEMETSGGRCIYGLSVLFCDCHSVMSSRRQTYEKPPPGLIKEDETKPEDCIPDVPGNEHAREFLAHAPTKGLWMPLGKEVKVMQCWRCKRYGHRTGDKECPFFIKGNQKLEQFRVAHEDPMYDIIRENKRHEKDIRIQQLKQLLEDSTSDEDGSSSSSSECKEKHKKKKKKEKHKKRKKEKKKKKKRKHKSSKSNESSDSD